MRQQIDITGDRISLKDAMHQIATIVENLKSTNFVPTWNDTQQINSILANYLGWKTLVVTAYTNEDSEYREWVSPDGIAGASRPTWANTVEHATLLYPRVVPNKLYSNPLYIILDALRERYYETLKDQYV
jgi:hypothetical protein